MSTGAAIGKGAGGAQIADPQDSLAINGNGGMNTTYKRNPFAACGASGAAGVDLKQIFVSPTLAVRLGAGQAPGVSPVVVVQTFRATGIQPFASASADPAHFTNQGTDWSAGVGVRVGWPGHCGRAVRAGAFYESKIVPGRKLHHQLAWEAVLRRVKRDLPGYDS